MSRFHVVRCPDCDAGPGDPCRPMNLPEIGRLLHPSRVRAFTVAEKLSEQNTLIRELRAALQAAIESDEYHNPAGDKQRAQWRRLTEEVT